MSFSLSFSPEFFLAAGEPYDRADLALNANGEPYSVYSAICLMQHKRRTEWRLMAREVFGCKPEHLNAETVLEMLQATDSCATLSVPVEVYIDADHRYSVQVWEATHYSYGSGMSGCLFDNQGTARTKDDAIEAALSIFDGQISGREMKRAKAALRADGIYYFRNTDESGAQYVEVSEQRGECPENE